MNGLQTYDDVRALKLEGELGKFIKSHMVAARTEAAHRRTLVLKHPDLAKQLTEPPIKFSRPEVWNGYIPPATDCTGAINTSPCRRVLVALVAEAEARAAGTGAEPEASTEAA